MQLEWLNFGIADESRANSKLGLLGPSDSLETTSVWPVGKAKSRLSTCNEKQTRYSEQKTPAVCRCTSHYQILTITAIMVS